jgi:hypothetical protein
MTIPLLGPPAVADADTCFICGRPANSVEHIIPAWLQQRFGLWDQELRLPNGTAVPYRQLTIPACTQCNTRIFGALEQRVSTGAATDAEIWRWANKIHYGLGHKDRFLAWDRANANLKIGDVLNADDPFEKSRHFLHCVAGDFRTDPDPFGSVFVFDFASPQPFAFAHFLASSSICISTGDRGYVVFVEDGQALGRDRGLRLLLSQLPPKTSVPDMLFFYAQCVEHAARHTLGQSVIMTQSLLVRIGPTVVHDVRPPNKARFRAICAALGIHWIDRDESV